VSECDSLQALSPAQPDRLWSQSQNGRLPSFAIEIPGYLREHPEVQDTLEGVMLWWVSERAIKHWLPQVRASLALLVARGHLEKADSSRWACLLPPEPVAVPHQGGSQK
jgi:hypothetical protein